ncbi:methionine ABC transporter ATP-binding protein [Silvanigrella aquatica]|uniref:Cell division ATP-binding protein FtsE n=1 Tax=Silvanigrella aquatica TaxID=1915309 RepID=A0A1L4D351_9BACT|nr:methionine ABC transporter ATP-binding protein [Silvanigrella aquatica]APJ04617.1 methionine ABC transporter ATP-binding protein [Silvanigrella aquatica]
MIKLIGIKKYFTTKQGTAHALKGIDLHVSKGEIFGIIGKSGAGKSTLLRTVNLLEKPTEGEVILDDVSLTSLKEVELRKQRRNIGMIFQHFNLLSSATAFKNIALPLELAGVDKKEIQERVLYLLEVTGLSDKGDHYPHQLSGGQKQRVAIARSLASNPKVLLCDEATSALDPETTKSILTLLKEINEKFGVTILLITHEMDVVKSICDRVAVIENGEIIESSSMVDLFSNPQTPNAKAMVRSAFHIALPENMEKQLSPYPGIGLSPVLKFTFVGNSASESIISTLIVKFGLRVNILQAHIDLVRNSPLGIMLCQVTGEQNQIQSGINFLSQSNITTEVIGYVSGNIKYTA